MLPAPAAEPFRKPDSPIVYEEGWQRPRSRRRRSWHSYAAAGLAVVVIAATGIVATRGAWSPYLARLLCGAKHEVYTSPEYLVRALERRLNAGDACGVARLHVVTTFDPRRHDQVRAWRPPGPVTLEPSQWTWGWADADEHLSGLPSRPLLIYDADGRVVGSYRLQWWPPDRPPGAPGHWHLAGLMLD